MISANTRVGHVTHRRDFTSTLHRLLLLLLLLLLLVYVLTSLTYFVCIEARPLAQQRLRRHVRYNCNAAAHCDMRHALRGRTAS